MSGGCASTGEFPLSVEFGAGAGVSSFLTDSGRPENDTTTATTRRTAVTAASITSPLLWARPPDRASAAGFSGSLGSAGDCGRSGGAFGAAVVRIVSDAGRRRPRVRRAGRHFYSLRWSRPGQWLGVGGKWFRRGGQLLFLPRRCGPFRRRGVGRRRFRPARRLFLWGVDATGFNDCRSLDGGFGGAGGFSSFRNCAGAFGDGPAAAGGFRAAGAAASSPIAIASSLRFNSWSSGALALVSVGSLLTGRTDIRPHVHQQVPEVQLAVDGHFFGFDAASEDPRVDDRPWWYALFKRCLLADQGRLRSRWGAGPLCPCRCRSRASTPARA